MDVATFARTRFGSPGRTALLVVGDVLAILVFFVIGNIEHGFDPTNVDRILRSAAPFVFGWLVVAIPAGLYGRSAVPAPIRVPLFIVPAWVPAALIGSALRSTSHFPGYAPQNFVMAAMGFGALFLLIWRLTVSLVQLLYTR
jgi:hypothetical protein